MKYSFHPVKHAEKPAFRQVFYATAGVKVVDVIVKMRELSHGQAPVILSCLSCLAEQLHSRSDCRDHPDAAAPAPVYAGASTTCRWPLEHIPVFCHV